MKKYNQIVKHYENCLEKHGDTHLGVDWPNLEHVNLRYNIMLDILSFSKSDGNISFLDFGCGTAHLLDHMTKNGFSNVMYSGLDIPKKFLAVWNGKYPETSFFCGDVLYSNFKLPAFDYIVMNGVFTEKRELTFEMMWKYSSIVNQGLFIM